MEKIKINNIYFSYGDYNIYNTNYIGNSESYFPLFGIEKLNLNIPSDMRGGYSKEISKKYENFELDIYSFTFYYHRNVIDEQKLPLISTFIKDKITDFLKEKPYKINYNGNIRNTYSNLFLTIKNNSTFSPRSRISTFEFISGKYFLGEYINESEINVLFTLVIKREYLEYVKLCILTDNEIHPDVFEFWVSKDFDKPKSKYRSARTFYKKEILTDIRAKGITIVEKDNFSELFNNIYPPKFNSIFDYQNWLKYSTSKFLAYTKGDTSFKIDPKYENIKEAPKVEVKVEEVVVKKRTRRVKLKQVVEIVDDI